jgi:hypothetical protein
VYYGEIDTSSITSFIGNHVVDFDVTNTVTLSSGESERLNECVVCGGAVICDEK